MVSKHGMRRNDFYGDRKVAKIFEVSPLQVLAAKIGEQDFNLEDMRYCLHCQRFFDAQYFISTVEILGDAEFVCARCSADFEGRDTEGRQRFMDRCQSTFTDLRWEYKVRTKTAELEGRKIEKV